jgi:Fe-S-cluster-containing dehydrogenase component
MVRVFMSIPGAEVPHLCTQCSNYPCVASCPFKALSTSEKTGAVIVDKEKCTACGICIKACPGNVPHMHPNKKYIVICDLCDGDPECAKVCTRAGYNALTKSTRTSAPSSMGVSLSYDLYAKNPEETTANLAVNLYGEKGEELTK